MLRKRSIKCFFANEFFLLAPVIYFLVLMSFFYQAQCGIRHIIFIYPFLFICSGALSRVFTNKYHLGIIVLLSLYLIISVFKYRANYIPYTNEFIVDKVNAYEKVGASNLEYQQGYYFAKDYMERHPEVQWAPSYPKIGKFLISTEDYLDVWNRHTYSWLAEIKPSGHVAYNYLILDVPNLSGREGKP